MSIGLPKGMSRNDAHIQGVADGRQEIVGEIERRHAAGEPISQILADIRQRMSEGTHPVIPL